MNKEGKVVICGVANKGFEMLPILSAEMVELLEEDYPIEGIISSVKFIHNDLDDYVYEESNSKSNSTFLKGKTMDKILGRK